MTLSKGWDPIDFTADGGFMWGLSGTTLYRLNLSNGTVTTFSAPSKVKSGNFGAAWTFSNGNLGFSNNQTGDIYQISVTNPASATPTFGLVSNYTGPVAGQSNDGAACVAQPVDLGITKTGPTLVGPGATVTWTLTVKNNGPGNSSGFAVSDTVPTGVTNVTSPTSGCQVTGNSVLCSEGAPPTAPALPSRYKARHRPPTGPASRTPRQLPATSPIRTRPTTRPRHPRPAPPRRSLW